MELPGTEITAPRQKVYPRNYPGKFRRLRNFFSFSLQALLFAVPWLQWNGRQAVLADIPGRKLFLFGLVLHPQDTYFLHLMLILSVRNKLVIFINWAWNYFTKNNSLRLILKDID